VVTVTTHGPATIPKVFGEKLGIEAPGRVRFLENEAGEVPVERIPTAEEMRGFATRGGEADEERPGPETLREKRAADKERRPEAGDEASSWPSTRPRSYSMRSP
jgi:bifunctional DNA-binding transcriptional regulator/antitoxin component of YhaV-PrlF toxin-antitoxin module